MEGVAAGQESIARFSGLHFISRADSMARVDFKELANFARMAAPTSRSGLMICINMAILSILEFPDERLRKKALPVPEVDASIVRLVDDMFETMYAAPGIGLAATQVNIHKRVLVLDVSEEKNTPLCFINPEIIQKNGKCETEEGCLSVPGIFEKVSRSEKIVVRALNREGEAFEMEAEGLLAVCIQHEIDHLNGKLFVDHLSTLKKQLVRSRLKKEQRHRSTASASRDKTSATV